MASKAITKTMLEAARVREVGTPQTQHINYSPHNPHSDMVVVVGVEAILGMSPFLAHVGSRKNFKGPGAKALVTPGKRGAVEPDGRPHSHRV